LNNKIVVGGSQLDINTDVSTVDPSLVGSMSAKVKEAAAPPAGGRYAGMGIAGAPIDPHFVEMVDASPDVQRVTALAESEAIRLLAAANKVAQPNMTPQGYTKPTSVAPVTKLSLPDMQRIVRKVVAANMQGWSQDMLSLADKNMTQFLMNEQQLGKLAPPQ
jgi:hypothetical protein